MLPIWNVLLGLWVDVLLGQTKVDDVDGILFRGTSPADQEVLWFHVAIDQVFTVNILYSGDLYGVERLRYHCASETPSVCAVEVHVDGVCSLEYSVTMRMTVEICWCMSVCVRVSPTGVQL